MCVFLGAPAILLHFRSLIEVTNGNTKLNEENMITLQIFVYHCEDVSYFLLANALFFYLITEITCLYNNYAIFLHLYMAITSEVAYRNL